MLMGLGPGSSRTDKRLFRALAAPFLLQCPIHSEKTMKSDKIIKAAEGFLSAEAEQPGTIAAIQLATLIKIAESLERIAKLAEKAAAQEGGAA